MWPDRVSNPGPLTYESGALPTALRGAAKTALFAIAHANFDNYQFVKCLVGINFFFFPLRVDPVG